MSEEMEIIENLERRLEAHIKGESIEHQCGDCGKTFSNVEGEAIECPFCFCAYARYA